MSLSGELFTILKEHDLMAFIVNEGWILIRRKNYVDLFIDDQPYNSVEVLLQPVNMVRYLFSLITKHSEVIASLLFSIC